MQDTFLKFIIKLMQVAEKVGLKMKIRAVALNFMVDQSMI